MHLKFMFAAQKFIFLYGLCFRKDVLVGSENKHFGIFEKATKEEAISIFSTYIYEKHLKSNRISK